MSGGVDMERVVSNTGPMEYTETIMMGSHVQKELVNFVRSSQRFRSMRMGDKKLRTRDEQTRPKSRAENFIRCSDCPIFGERVRSVARYVSSVFCEEWLFLAILSIIVGCLSYLMDFGIFKFQEANLMMYYELRGYMWLQYFAWVLYPMILVLASVAFCHVVGPNAVGSGIPEMKTILRGVTLKDYLSVRTLIAKVVGLVLNVGSGMPTGKEGPFIHIASMVAAILSRSVTAFQGMYKNPARYTEILSAACAVGVACHFAAPIGGVLFSIEVTSTFFAVRNYWRGFFGAVVGTTIFQLIGTISDDKNSITALFVTDFPIGVAYHPAELVLFALLGVIGGFLGSLYTWWHRQCVLFVRKPAVHKFFSLSRFLYPAIVTFSIATLTFPPWLGQYMAADLGAKTQVNHLFSNFAWSTGSHTLEQEQVIEHWSAPQGGIFLGLIVFMVAEIILSAIAITMPVPCGVFVPALLIGASAGRLMGETLNFWIPAGLANGMPFYPGGYALAGAAAVTGSVTHTASTAVIIFEISGQILYAIPVLIAVLMSNIVAQYMQPSLFDSIVQLKNLSFLPDLSAAKIKFFDLMAEDIIHGEFTYVSYSSSYKEVYRIIKNLQPTEVLPVVESNDSMVLMGVVRVSTLKQNIKSHIGKTQQLAFLNSGKNWEELRMQTMGYLTDGGIKLNTLRSGTLRGTPFEPGKSLEVASSNKPTEKKEKVKPITNNFTGSLLFSTSPESTIQASESEKFRKELLTNQIRSKMSHQELIEWEEMRMQMEVELSLAELDTSPFAVTGTTSLAKLHNLYLLFGLRQVYVTIMGKIVGVISLHQFQKAMRHPDEFIPVILSPQYFGGEYYPVDNFEEPEVDYDPNLMETTGPDSTNQNLSPVEQKSRFTATTVIERKPPS